MLKFLSKLYVLTCQCSLHKYRALIQTYVVGTTKYILCSTATSIATGDRALVNEICDFTIPCNLV